jgi:polysaccharide pyruvyl transferase WcaK-like protein
MKANRQFTRRSFFKLSGTAAIAASIHLPLTVESSNRKPLILLYSGWNTQNIGDQGHTPGTLRFLYDYYPQANITLWLSSTNEETIQLLSRRFPKINYFVQGKIDEQGICDNKLLQEAFDSADLVIQNSGMLYNSFWKAPTILEACVNTQKPFVCYGQSFDGFDNKDLPIMVERLSKAQAIYCRDIESYYYLRKIGARPRILEFGPDGCFGIDLLNEDKGQRFMRSHNLEAGKFISVIIRTNTPAGNRPKILPEWDIGDKSQNPWDPDDKDAQQTALWMRKVRELIIQWIRTTGQKVLLAPEVRKEIEYAKYFIYDQLPEDVLPKVVHRQEWWNMDEACSIYRQSRAIVGLEPHSLIMGLAHGVPVIHMFSKRHGLKAWMFRDIGLPEWLVDIDQEPASSAIDALMNIHGDYPRAKEKVKRSMNYVESRSAEMVKDIVTIVES